MSSVGSTMATGVRASLGRSSSSIVSAVALFFLGVIINTTIPAFEQLASSGKGIAHAEETKPVQSPSKPGGYTAASFDLKNRNRAWTRTMEEFHRDRSDLFHISNAGPRDDISGW